GKPDDEVAPAREDARAPGKEEQKESPADGSHRERRAYHPWPNFREGGKGRGEGGTMLEPAHLVAALALSLPLPAAACGDSEVLEPSGVCSGAPLPAGSPAFHGQQALQADLDTAGSTATVRIVLAGDGCSAPLLASGGAVLSEAPESYAIC